MSLENQLPQGEQHHQAECGGYPGNVTDQWRQGNHASDQNHRPEGALTNSFQYIAHRHLSLSRGIRTEALQKLCKTGRVVWLVHGRWLAPETRGRFRSAPATCENRLFNTLERINPCAQSHRFETMTFGALGRLLIA